jgi:hypothetical protein
MYSVRGGRVCRVDSNAHGMNVLVHVEHGRMSMPCDHCVGIVARVVVL